MAFWVLDEQLPMHSTRLRSCRCWAARVICLPTWWAFICKELPTARTMDRSHLEAWIRLSSVASCHTRRPLARTAGRSQQTMPVWTATAWVCKGRPLSSIPELRMFSCLLMTLPHCISSFPEVPTMASCSLCLVRLPQMSSSPSQESGTQYHRRTTWASRAEVAAKATSLDTRHLDPMTGS